MIMNNISRVLCLCPVWGHTTKLINNALACFEGQKDKVDALGVPLSGIQPTMLIIDDRPYTAGNYYLQLTPAKYGRSLVKLRNRAPSLGVKYNMGIAHHLRVAINYDHPIMSLATCDYLDRLCDKYDAVALWDDDDIYTPHHLSLACFTMNNSANCSPWYYPSWVGSTYGNQLRREPTSGRFWASSVISTKLLREMGGFPDYRVAQFDQWTLRDLTAKSVPNTTPNATYIYRWEDTGEGHCSGLMKDPLDTSWYDNTMPDMDGGDIKPVFDRATEKILIDENWNNWPIAG